MRISICRKLKRQQKSELRRRNGLKLNYLPRLIGCLDWLAERVFWRSEFPLPINKQTSNPIFRQINEARQQSILFSIFSSAFFFQFLLLFIKLRFERKERRRLRRKKKRKKIAALINQIILLYCRQFDCTHSKAKE